MKLEIQKFGGRGASSSTNTIDGRPIAKSTSGYRFWNIGTSAPEGYIGLIRGEGRNAETTYFKTKYADEIRNFRWEETDAMNYSSIKMLDSQISRTENALDKIKSQEKFGTASDIRKRRFRLENRLEKLRRVREIRKDLGL